MTDDLGGAAAVENLNECEAENSTAAVQSDFEHCETAPLNSAKDDGLKHETDEASSLLECVAASSAPLRSNLDGETAALSVAARHDLNNETKGSLVESNAASLLAAVEDVLVETSAELNNEYAENASNASTTLSLITSSASAIYEIIPGRYMAVFTEIGTTAFTLPADTALYNVQLLLVAGGGSGGASYLGGGGGAGGLFSTLNEMQTNLTLSGIVTVTVGAGGAGEENALNGGDTSLVAVAGQHELNQTVHGGGAGGSDGDGQPGGSGGGGGYCGNGGSAIDSAFGSDGGCAGGGGGFTTAGGNNTGIGGDGISFVDEYPALKAHGDGGSFAGGGGGYGGLGGLGGGGGGVRLDGEFASGGGGGSGRSTVGGDGGSGIAVLIFSLCRWQRHRRADLLSDR